MVDLCLAFHRRVCCIAENKQQTLLFLFQNRKTIFLQLKLETYETKKVAVFQFLLLLYHTFTLSASRQVRKYNLAGCCVAKLPH